jgi:DNA repair exonuclease SbcCD ATPase subunit
MSIKTDDQANNALSNTKFSYNGTNNKMTKSLDETKDNINKPIDEPRNQTTRYNNIVNSYQEQSLQTAKEMSEEYIESQKAVINSLQSAWRPYNESFNGLFASFASPDSITKAYTKFVSNFADNAVSAMRLTNCFIFSNLDSMKSTLQQAKDNSKRLSNLTVNTAKTFEQNSRELAASIEESVTNYNNNLDNNTEDTDNINSTANTTTK